MGRTTTKNIFHPSHRLESCGRKSVHHLALQKGPNRLDHQLNQQWDPTQSLDHLLPSSDPDLCPSAFLSLTIAVLLVGHSYYPTRFYPRAHPTHIYVSHAIQILKNPPEYTMRNRVQSGRNTKNIAHAHLLGIA